jgi:hypothetical protein
MNVDGLLWIAGLPILAGMGSVAWPRAIHREGVPALVTMGAFALCVLMVLQISAALAREGVTRLVDSGFDWWWGLSGGPGSDPFAPSLGLESAGEAPANLLGLVVEPLTLAPLFGLVVLGLAASMRDLASEAAMRRHGWLTVAIGAASFAVLARTGVGVLGGWWLAGWALRRMQPDAGSTVAHVLSDAAMAMALAVAHDASGSWDLVVQRVSSVTALRADWIDLGWTSVSRADVIVTGWVVAMAGRCAGILAGARMSTDAAPWLALGATATLPWLGVVLRLAPWIGSAPGVDAVFIASAGGASVLLMARARAAAARWDAAGVSAALGGVGPAFVTITALAGGGFVAVEIALVHALALPLFASSFGRRPSVDGAVVRRDWVPWIGALALAGVAPLAGHLSTARGLRWAWAHESVASPAVNAWTLACLALVSIGAAGAVGRIMGARSTEPETPSTGLMAPALSLGLLALTAFILPAGLGAPSELAQLFGVAGDTLYGPAATGDASRYFVGARLSVMPAGTTTMSSSVVAATHFAQGLALVSLGVGARRARAGAAPIADGLVRRVGSWARPLMTILGLPFVAFRDGVRLIALSGIDRDGGRTLRTAIDRAGAWVPHGLRRHRASVVVAAVMVLVFGWIFLKPSISTLGPTNVHSFGGLHPRMRAVADPSRARKRASDEAREIIERADPTASGATATATEPKPAAEKGTVDP